MHTHIAVINFCLELMFVFYMYCSFRYKLHQHLKELTEYLHYRNKTLTCVHNWCGVDIEVEKFWNRAVASSS